MSGGLRQGFLVLTGAQVAFMISGYATHIALARVLGPAEYGTYGVTLSVLSTVALVLSGGFPEAIAKFASERPEDAPGIFARGIGIQFWFSLALGASYAALSPIIGLSLRDHALVTPLLISALAVPPTALYAVVVGAFNGQRRFTAQALAVAGYGGLRALFVIGLGYHFRITGAVASLAIAPLLVVCIALPWTLRLRAQGKLEARELWAFAKPVIGFTVALALLMALDLYVVKAIVRDADEVGYYTAATTIAKVPYFFFSTLGVVLLPIVSSAGTEGRDAVRALARDAIRLIFAVALGVIAVVVPFSRAVLAMLYGERYAVAAASLGLLVAAMTLFTLTFIVAYTLKGLGRPEVGMRLTVAGLGLEVLLALLLAPKFGAVGAAAASFLAAVCILIAMLYFASPSLGVVLPLKSALRIALALLVTLASGFALPHVHPVHLLFMAPLALGYFAVLGVLRELTAQQVAGWVRRDRVSG